MENIKCLTYIRYFWPCCMVWRISVPRVRIEPGPWWECRVYHKGAPYLLLWPFFHIPASQSTLSLPFKLCVNIFLKALFQLLISGSHSQRTRVPSLRENLRIFSIALCQTPHIYCCLHICFMFPSLKCGRVLFREQRDLDSATLLRNRTLNTAIPP